MKKLLGLLCFFISLCFASTTPSHLTLLLDWFPNPNHAPIFIAQEKGFFKQEGLDVAIISPTNAYDGSKMVALGKADLAIDYQTQLVPQVLNGLPLVRVGTLIDSPLSCIITLENSGIKTLADLKGKRIAYTPGSSNFSLDIMLKKYNLSLQDVKLIAVNKDLVQALLTGNVDAFSGGSRNFEAIQLKQLGHPAHAFFVEDNGIPPYDELIFVANQRNAKNPAIQKFLHAIEQANQYIQKNPEAAWKIFSENNPALNNPFNHDAWLATLPYFAKSPAKLDKNKYESFTKFLYDHGKIKTVPALETYAQ